MRDNTRNLVKQLITIPGLSAYEGPISDVISDIWRPLLDEIQISRLGSLHGLRKGRGEEPRRRILVSAHMDAIGLMVTGISKDGFLQISEIGGVDPKILPGQPVNIHISGKEPLFGIVIHPPEFLLPNHVSGKPAGLEYLFVDTGLSAREVKRLVHVGDIISFSQEPIEIMGDFIAGHSLDNRASIAALTLCLQELQPINHAWDVWAVATAQEEVTQGGGKTSSFQIRPDLAIVVDVTFAKGPGVNDYRGYQMEKGPALGWGPNIHPALYELFKELSEELDIPHQIEVMPRHSGTDAFAIQVVAEGIPSMVLSIPLRYMHTPVEMVSLKDIERTGHLLAQFIARLDVETMENLNWKD